MLKKSLLHTITVSAALLLSACGGGDSDAGDANHGGAEHGDTNQGDTNQGDDANQGDVGYGDAYGQLDACQQGCLDSSCSEVFGCPALFNCITGCDEEESCQDSCMEGASASARAAILSVAMCAAKSCEGSVEVEIDYCGTCVLGTECGQDEACKDLSTCLHDCGSDESCNTNCKSGKEAALVTSAESALTSCASECGAE